MPLEVPTTAFDGMLYSNYRYSVEFRDASHSVAAEADWENTPKGILKRFITSVSEALAAQETREPAETTGSDPELGGLRSLFHSSYVFAFPFVRPWLGMEIPRDPAMIRARLAGEPGGCLFVLCCPKNLQQIGPADFNRLAPIMSSILSGAALIEARQQRVEQKKLDHVSSLHGLSTLLMVLDTTITNARIALADDRHEKGFERVRIAEVNMKRLKALHKASILAWKVDRHQAKPEDPSTPATTIEFIKKVEEIVKETIEATSRSRTGAEGWTTSRGVDIGNVATWACESGVLYDEWHLWLTVGEAIENCVKHGGGQDGFSLRADPEEGPYLWLIVRNRLNPEQNAQLLEQEISRRTHDKLGLYQMTQAARAWTFPVPRLLVDVQERSFIVTIGIAIRQGR